MTFDEYARTHLMPLLGTATAICCDARLAEDLVQDVLVKLHARWPAVSSMAMPEAYVRRMLINEFLSWRRKWARMVPDPEPTRHFRSVPDHDDHAAAQAERDELLGDIRRLPARQRAVIGLRYYADLSDDQIADALGCAESTVRVHASRALASLRIARGQPSSASRDGGAS